MIPPIFGLNDKVGKKPFKASFLELLKQNEQLRVTATATAVATK